MSTPQLDQRWPYAPHVHSDELFSSYMIRLAHAHGTSPSRFFHYCMPGVAVWNRDIDVCGSREFVRAVAERSGMPLDEVIALGISETASHCQTRIGIYHRMRSRAGLRFCASCLADSAYVRRVWRCAWVAVCTVHRMALQDHCPSCSAAYVPHRARSISRCFACDADLSKIDAATASLSVRALQHNAATSDAFLKQDLSCILCIGTSASLTNASAIYHAMRRACVLSRATRKVGANSVFGRAMGLGLPAMSSVAQTQVHLDALYETIEDGIHGLERIARVYSLRQNHFEAIEPNLPSQFHDFIAALPARQVAKSTRLIAPAPRSHDLLRWQIHRLHKRRDAGWRLERALLLQAVVRSNHGT